ncbi:hypothetical protein TVAG_385620 [Trichomonas vaginalis G3]|uniref:Peroxin-7 n=1 Tax=Trichomonas vaginalis (strain ATCC PRA-98 / G3) TaxID=412133 RepID=A2FU15_TRIV3|nr:chromatin organization [Trichomonas vaginalis G3]EAX91610.1 hypothetical protein TVAG_385620 [Trichomonas vaginalis G3]KAI5517299.1 chromatin organization [Trichomonas vaginalis G3]|eukprot:XP_001304540.1 hypothetical protein [Trichomonas vaginalis G3]
MQKDISLWRTKAENYFGLHNEYVKNSVCQNIKSPQKIVADYLLPLSYYVDALGNCRLYSLDGAYKYNEIGSCNLNIRPTSIASSRDNLLVSTTKGVMMYTTNASLASRAQNIDDFMQMALPVQEQPKDLGEPVIRFFSCDTKVEGWANKEFSVIPYDEFKDDKSRIAKKSVDKFYEQCKKETPFKAEQTFFFDHTDVMKQINSNNPPPPPITGPVSTAVRQVSYTWRNLQAFVSIMGTNWFNWDITRQKLKNGGYGGGFQISSLDISPILRETFAVGTYGGYVKIVDLRSKQDAPELNITSDFSPVSVVKFSPIVQPLLATTSSDFSVKLWDLRIGFEKPFLVLEGHDHQVSSIQFSNHRADFLFTSSYDGSIAIWNINNQYPPHHCLTKVTPSPGAKILEMVAGYHRADSFYYSCSDGVTGVYELRPKLFRPVIPHRLTTTEDQEAEELSYFRRNQLLLSKILPKINRVFEKKEDVTPIFPLLDLAKSVPFDLENVGMSQSPLADIISHYSYYTSNAIPMQLQQIPEPQQLSDAGRANLFAKVIGSIQKKDPATLMVEKRNIILVLDAFSREQILGIVQVISLSSFEDALEVGGAYLELVTTTNKADKFLDVGYFLLYPTVYDDPTQKFIPYTEKSVDEKTRLKPIFDNTSKIKQELADLQAIIATAANDAKISNDMYKTLQRYDSFVSLFLCRTYLSLMLSMQQWSFCIIRAASIAKELAAFPIKKVLFDWIEAEVTPRFFPTVARKIADEKITDVQYAVTIAEIIVIGIGADEITPTFEENITKLIGIVKNSLEKVINGHECVKIFGKNSFEIASMIQKRIDELKHFSSTKTFQRCRSAQSLATLIANAANKA